MNKNYQFTLSVSDPYIYIQIPSSIVKDVVRRSEENGHSIELEFALRLARTLERDVEMNNEDDAICLKAFKKQQF